MSRFVAPKGAWERLGGWHPLLGSAAVGRGDASKSGPRGDGRSARGPAYEDHGQGRTVAFDLRLERTIAPPGTTTPQRNAGMTSRFSELLQKARGLGPKWTAGLPRTIPASYREVREMTGASNSLRQLSIFRMTPLCAFVRPFVRPGRHRAGAWGPDEAWRRAFRTTPCPASPRCRRRIGHIRGNERPRRVTRPRRQVRRPGCDDAGVLLGFRWVSYHLIRAARPIGSVGYAGVNSYAEAASLS